LRAERSNLVFSTQDKLRNLGFKEINNFEIATPALNVPGQAQQKALLAMTFLEFFSSLLSLFSAPSAVKNGLVCFHKEPRSTDHCGERRERGVKSCLFFSFLIFLRALRGSA
jgi:hypothetical protein